MNDPKTTRCTTCCSEYTDAEIVNAEACPNCGSQGLPCAINQDVEVKINWHELRIICMWASNWASRFFDPKKDADSIKALDAIIKRLESYRKEGWAALTLMGEIKELSSDLQKLGISNGGVELYQQTVDPETGDVTLEKTYPPRPVLRVVEPTDE